MYSRQRPIRPRFENSSAPWDQYLNRQNAPHPLRAGGKGRGGGRGDFLPSGLTSYDPEGIRQRQSHFCGPRRAGRRHGGGGSLVGLGPTQIERSASPLPAAQLKSNGGSCPTECAPAPRATLGERCRPSIGLIPPLPGVLMPQRCKFILIKFDSTTVGTR